MSLLMRSLTLTVLVAGHLLYVHALTDGPYHGTGSLWGAIIEMLAGLFVATGCHVGASVYAARTNIWPKRGRTVLIIGGLLITTALGLLPDLQGDVSIGLTMLQLLQVGIVGALLFGRRRS